MSWRSRFVGVTLAVAVAGAGIAFMSDPAVAQAKPVTLKGIVPYHPQNYLAQPLFILQRMLDEKTGGQIKIDIIGAEEVVPALEQFDALRNGVVDISLGVASYYNNTIPEALGIQYNKDFVPTELRKNGYYDLIRKLHLERGNVIYLANASGTPGRAFRFYLRKAVDRPDFSGLKIRVSPVYTALVRALNGTPVAIPPAEAYSALERGVVDGLGWTYAGTLDYGFPEVAKYVLDQPFYSLNSAILMNRATWERLPEDARKRLDEIAVDFEGAVEKYYADYISEEDARVKAKGAQFVRFSPEGAKRFNGLAYEAGWSEFLSKNPVSGPKIKELLTK
jgi:TRAP-type C4-dicarboxylate transport system substrate-binding protein